MTAETLPSLPELSAEQAEHWVAAALAEASALRQHDEQLYPSTADANALLTARQLHAAWRRWADAADVLVARIRPLLASRRHVAGAHDLEYAIGRVQAMLKLPPDVVLHRQAQAQRGEVLMPEEVRRELRLESRG